MKAGKTKPLAKKGKKAGSKRDGKFLAALGALEDVSPPPIPAANLIAEGHALAKVATKYAEALRKVGLDAKLARSLADRAELLASAQSDLAITRANRRTKREVALEAEAIAARRDMVADGRYALRNDAEAQAALDRVQEGEGLDDLIQDLRDLATFHRTHARALAKIGVKGAGKATRAEELAAELSAAVSARRAGNEEESAALDLRNRAATYLVLAMREVREAGAYAFRSKPDVAARFRGAYAAQHRSRSTKPNGQPAPAPPDPPADT
jgi:hypothetical protein